MARLIQNDARIKREHFKEMADLLGIAAYYQFIDGNESYSIHSEFRGRYSDMIPINIIFIEFPKQRTLKSLGWAAELQGTPPIIAQIPYDVPNLKWGCRITLPSDGTQDLRVFRITEITTDVMMPDCRWVQLAPEILTSDTGSKGVYEEGNFNYLKDDGE